MHQLSARLFAQLLRKLPRFSHVPPSPPGCVLRALQWHCSSPQYRCIAPPRVNCPPSLKQNRNKNEKQLPQARSNSSPSQVPLGPALLAQWAWSGAGFVCVPGRVTEKPQIFGEKEGAKKRFKEVMSKAQVFIVFKKDDCKQAGVFGMDAPRTHLVNILMTGLRDWVT